MKLDTNTVIQFLVGGIVGGAGVGLYLYLRELLQIQQPGWITSIVIFLLAFFIVVLIHETGHLIAGKAVGFSFYMITVGPFKIQKFGTHLRPGINKHLNISGGLTLMLPQESDPDDSKMYWYIAGGPLASIIVGIFSTAVLVITVVPEISAPAFLNYALFVTGFLSFIIGFISIIPTNSMTFSSDGSQLIDLYRGGEKAVMKQQMMSIFVKMWNGTRPREIDKDILDSVLAKTETDFESELGSTINTEVLTARLIAVYYYLDKCEIDKAESILNLLIQKLEKESNSLLEGSVFIEKAFICAAFRKEAKRAERYLNKGKKRFVEKHAIARAESAYMISLGNIEEGIALAKKGLKVADHSIDKGGIIYEKEMLRQLAKGKLPEI